MTGSAVRSDPGNRRSHGSVFDAMCLAVNCPTPQRARLFKARMQRWWACRIDVTQRHKKALSRRDAAVR